MFAATGPVEYMPNLTQHKLFKSTDKGLSWLDASGINFPSSMPLPNRYVSAIKIDKDDPNGVFASFAGFGSYHIYRSANGGQQWACMDFTEGAEPRLPDVPVNDFEIYYQPSGQRIYFAATDIGVFSSTGNGVWLELEGGLPNSIVMDIEIHNSKLRAATFGRGIFEWDLSPAQNISGKTPHPATPYLFPNYPNPFNPETKIKYRVSKQTRVKIVVYDILGREVAVLVNKTQQPGTYEAVFNVNLHGTNLSSGIYFYKLTAKDFTEIRKMVLVK
jgi:hypothetical protein